MTSSSGSTVMNRRRMPPNPPISWPASANSGAVAFLVLLARAAPARIVPADLVLVVLDDGLLLLEAVAVPGALDRLLGGRIRPGCHGDRGLVERRGLDGGSAGVVEAAGLDLRGELLLRLGSDLHLDMEDEPRELLPDRVHERLEHG